MDSSVVVRGLLESDILWLFYKTELSDEISIYLYLSSFSRMISNFDNSEFHYIVAVKHGKLIGISHY